MQLQARKEEKGRARLALGGDRTNYPGDVGAPTADMLLVKILLNSIISTAGVEFMRGDIKNFYLCAPLDRYEYMRMPLDIFPAHIREQYDLENKVRGGYIYLEIRR